MKEIKHHQIKIPIEFRIACTIYKISIAEVLQVFIDHVKYYNFIDKTYEEGYSEAIHAIIFYVRSKKPRNWNSKAISHCEETFGQCMQHIYSIADPRNSGLSMPNKRKYAKQAVETICGDMKRVYTKSQTLYPDEVSQLTLSDDYCLLCEMYNCYPAEYLEYFMRAISLADAHSHKGLKLPYDNFVFDFFMKIAAGFGRDSSSLTVLTEQELDFYELMAELPLRLHHVRNIDKRFLILQEFYHTHYRAINQA